MGRPINRSNVELTVLINIIALLCSQFKSDGSEINEVFRPDPLLDGCTDYGPNSIDGPFYTLAIGI